MSNEQFQADALELLLAVRDMVEAYLDTRFPRCPGPELERRKMGIAIGKEMMGLGSALVASGSGLPMKLRSRLVTRFMQEIADAMVEAGVLELARAILEGKEL